MISKWAVFGFKLLLSHTRRHFNSIPTCRHVHSNMGLNGELRRYCAEILSEREPSYRWGLHGLCPNLFDARVSTQRGFSEVVRLPVGGIHMTQMQQMCHSTWCLKRRQTVQRPLLLTSFEQI